MKKKKLEAKLSETKKKLVKTRSKLKELKSAIETLEPKIAEVTPEPIAPLKTVETAKPKQPARSKTKKA